MSQTGSRTRRYALLLLRILALAYALLAGLRTVGDFDLGWQLATARWIVQHRQVPSTDVLSYTAQGREWVYPAGSQLLLYGVQAVGGWAALSWLQAAACVATIALLLRAGGMLAAALAILAVPSVALRTVPRADLFTTVLFAAFFLILWQHHRGQRGPLWLLPLLMAAWVNLHPGFAAGLTLLAAYAALEVLELPFAGLRASALARLRRAVPWLLLTAAATLLNPWGPRIYAALLRQNRVLQVHTHFVGEWSSSPLSPARLREALDWRDPGSSFWWLLALAVVVAVIALRRQWVGAALLLGSLAYFALSHIRFEPLFAIAAVIIGGSVLSAGGETAGTSHAPRRQLAASVLVLVAATALVGVRAADVVSDRYYLCSGQTSVFGAGASWWYPERAAAFLLRERLPGNVFHDYNLGGYLAWRIGPQYRDYIDGRLLPFGNEFYLRQLSLLQQTPESLHWRGEADRWGISTLILSVSRYAGLGSFPLQAFCQSKDWRAVYLDDVAVIFVRNTPSNAAWIQRLGIDCATAPLEPPAETASAASYRGRAQLYNFYANAGSILYVLGRDREAAAALDRAQQLFSDDPNLHLIRGQLLQANNRLADAEREYRLSLSLRSTDLGWYALARLYSAQRRYAEAARAVENSAELSRQPSERYRALGQVYLAMNQPQQALRAFDLAMRSSPYQGEARAWGAEFEAQVAEGYARAWRSLGDPSQAIRFQEQAAQLTPENPARWKVLADYYDAGGQGDKAREARRRAEAASGPAPPWSFSSATPSTPGSRPHRGK